MGLSSGRRTVQPGTRTVRLDLEFDGTDFEGWQRQASGRTVQGELESALERILGAPHAVVGCGRTDAGVHARAMIASFRTDHTMPASVLTRALDAVLPEDIGVLAARDAAPEFHARRDALWKWYRYSILVSRRKRPLLRRRVLRLAAVPPLDRLEEAAAALAGRHDFRSFANVGSAPDHTVRTLHALAWSREDELLRLDAVGDGFLYKMVRTLVGTMLKAAGPAVPALGLCLRAVALRGEPLPPRVPERLLRSVESGHHRAIGGTS